MKKVPRNPLIFDTIELYTAFGRESEHTFRSKEGDENFIAKVSEALHSLRDNPIILHGTRAQSMFEFITVSLENVKLIKVEDSGSIFSKDVEVRPADFRVILESDETILVEVKNFSQKKPDELFQLSEKYFNQIFEYAKLQKLPLKFAIYWHKMNVWTLIDSKHLASVNGKKSISFRDAVVINEMSILGDLMIGTIPPLEMRIIPDPNKPRTIDKHGKCYFIIGDLQLFSGGERIYEKEEKSLALSFMLLSNWVIDDAIAEVDGNQLLYFTFTAKPEYEDDSGQPFEMLGYLSSMISRQFQLITTSKGEIKKIAPTAVSTQLGTQIQPDYRGKALHLWRFILKPNPDIL